MVEFYSIKCKQNSMFGTFFLFIWFCHSHLHIWCTVNDLHSDSNSEKTVTVHNFEIIPYKYVQKVEKPRKSHWIFISFHFIISHREMKVFLLKIPTRRKLLHQPLLIKITIEIKFDFGASLLVHCIKSTLTTYVQPPLSWNWNIVNVFNNS